MYQRILKNMTQFRRRMEELVKEAQDSYTEGEVGPLSRLNTIVSQVRGYIDVFLAEAAKEGEGMEHYTVEQLIVTLIDFFTGGSGTMSE